MATTTAAMAMRARARAERGLPRRLAPIRSGSRSSRRSADCPRLPRTFPGRRGRDSPGRSERSCAHGSTTARSLRGLVRVVRAEMLLAGATTDDVAAALRSAGDRASRAEHARSHERRDPTTRVGGADRADARVAWRRGVRGLGTAATRRRVGRSPHGEHDERYLSVADRRSPCSVAHSSCARSRCCFSLPRVSSR